MVGPLINKLKLFLYCGHFEGMTILEEIVAVIIYNYICIIPKVLVISHTSRGTCIIVHISECDHYYRTVATLLQHNMTLLQEVLLD